MMLPEVKGNKESIKNLLEIFDGLLDYLTEHVSESSHNKSKFKYGQETEGMKFNDKPKMGSISWGGSKD